MKYTLIQEMHFLNAIRGPCITEKAEVLQTKLPHFLIEVAPATSKKTIKQAVEWLFGVQVDKVCTVNVKGKVKNFKQTTGKRKNWKKAYVCLKSGHTIDWMQLNRS
jgi:large subunit ribosomal protein L23